ncbi:MAG: phosphate acyltransferase [Candidatus Omnitrophota bacterium]
MGLLDNIRDRSKKDKKRIILPEGDDKRVAEAAGYLTKNGMAEIVLLKRGEKVERFDEMVSEFAEIRRMHKKEMTRTDIERLFNEKSVYIAGMMVRLGMADGFVAGAANETAEVARVAIYCVTIDEAIGVMSGAFVMVIPDSDYGHKGTFIFSDCAIVPFPKKEQLAGIAISGAKLADKILRVPSRVAMLSYSTKGSAATSDLALVRWVVESVRMSHPEINIDGEIQVDAALDPDAAKIKHSIAGSSVAGRANVLIFPNLDSGNIAYKLTQRLAKARAVGPILLGLKKPCCDLSRACSTEDIIDAVAITSVMAQ